MRVGIFEFGYEYALKSPEYPFKLSCVIFKGKRIFSVGYNSIRCCTSVEHKYKKFPESLHAEAAALAKFKPGELKGCSAFICRVNAGSKRTSQAKCCSYCQKMLFEYGIKKVFVTNDIESIDVYSVRPPEYSNKISVFESGHNYNSIYFELIDQKVA